MKYPVTLRHLLYMSVSSSLLLAYPLQSYGQVQPTAHSYSSHPEPLQPRIEAGAKVGTERSMGTMEGWAPIAQDDDSVLYADIRWMADDDENQEGNLGLGYRAIVSDKVAGGDAIVGGHAWIDRRRTDRGSNFYQITAGAEYLKEDWDVKANAYVPLNSEKEYTTANLGSATPYMAGTGLYVDTAGLLVEEAQPGGDVEVGYRIPAFEQNIDAIRVYGGAYGFIGDKSDDTVGGRIRTSVDINPLINVGARFQYDEPRGSQSFLEATLRFPIKAKKRFQQHGLRARLDESPERDIDIVTGAQVTDTGLRKEVINTTSGTTQRVIHVDNTAAGGGNGSVENPFNTLAAAQAAMLDNDVIYVHQGSGSTGMNQGIVIDKDNVQLIGSGTDFVYDTDRFTVRRPGPNGTDGSIIAAKTVAPVITNTTPTTGTYVGNGILAMGKNPVIAGVTVNGATRGGINIRAEQDFDSAMVYDVTLTGNLIGLSVKPVNGYHINDVYVANSTFNNNTTSGGAFIGADTAASQIHNITIDNVIANGNSGSGGLGLLVSAQSGGSITGQVTVKNSTAQSNGSHGISIAVTNGSMQQPVLVENNNTNSNTGSGIRLSMTNGSVQSVSVKDNISNSNSQSGIVLFSDTGGSLVADLDHNTTHNNARSGINAVTANTGSLTASIENSTITGNGTLSANPNFYYGVAIDHDGTGLFDFDLGGGTLGSTGGNRIYNNVYRDVFVDSRPGTAAATPGTTISAQGNWWGVGTGLNQGTRATFDNGSASPGSSIDTSNHLTTDPGI